MIKWQINVSIRSNLFASVAFARLFILGALKLLIDLLLSMFYKLLSKNGKCVIVVGNSAYGNIAIPTDDILRKLAKKIGFKKNYIIKARKLGTSSQQYKKVDDPKKLRESLVILSKC